VRGGDHEEEERARDEPAQQHDRVPTSPAVGPRRERACHSNASQMRHVGVGDAVKRVIARRRIQPLWHGGMSIGDRPSERRRRLLRLPTRGSCQVAPSIGNVLTVLQSDERPLHAFRQVNAGPASVEHVPVRRRPTYRELATGRRPYDANGYGLFPAMIYDFVAWLVRFSGGRGGASMTLSCWPKNARAVRREPVGSWRDPSPASARLRVTADGDHAAAVAEAATLTLPLDGRCLSRRDTSGRAAHLEA
jgi:hypothetical protein